MELRPAVEQILREYGLDVVGNTKATISASGLGVGIPLTLPHETSVTAGPKLHKQIQPYGNRSAAPSAGDAVAVTIDRNNNRAVIGKYVNNGEVITDADRFLGIVAAAPGNTLLLSQDSEVSTTSASFVDVNKFHVDRMGLYRIKVELARSGGTTQARVVRKLRDGTVVVVTGTINQSTLTYPTFGIVQTLDMTVPVTWGDILYFQLLNTSGPAQTAYAQNCRIYYQNALATITPYDAVL